MSDTDDLSDKNEKFKRAPLYNSLIDQENRDLFLSEKEGAPWSRPTSSLRDTEDKADQSQPTRANTSSQTKPVPNKKKVDRSLPFDSEEGRAAIGRCFPVYPGVELFDLPCLPDPPLLDASLKPVDQAYHLIRVYQAVSKKVFGKTNYAVPRKLEKSKHLEPLLLCADIMQAYGIAPFAWARWRFDYYLEDKADRSRVKPPPLGFVFAPDMMEKSYKFFHSQRGAYYPRTPQMTTAFNNLLNKYNQFNTEWLNKKDDLVTIDDGLNLLTALYKKYFGGFNECNEMYKAIHEEADCTRLRVQDDMRNIVDVWSYPWRGNK